MPKPGVIVRTPAGHPIRHNPARIEFAAELLRTMTYSKARDEIVKRWTVHRTTAEKDLRYAKQLIALELNGMEVRVAEVRRNERLADRAEELADEALVRARATDSSPAAWGAVAVLQRNAINASREVSRLTGAYAPKQVKVTHASADETPLRLDAALAVLDDVGRAALDVVLGQIEAARADGRLPAHEEEVDDAEFVEQEPDAGGEPGAAPGN